MFWEDLKLPEIESSVHVNSLSKEKVADLRSMFLYMPSVDKKFTESITSSSESKEMGNTQNTSQIMHSPKSAQRSVSDGSQVSEKMRSTFQASIQSVQVTRKNVLINQTVTDHR